MNTKKLTVCMLLSLAFLPMMIEPGFAGLRFCAVGWEGEFTHIDPAIGQVPPTRSDLPLRLQALAWSPEGTLYAGGGDKLYEINPLTGDISLYMTVGCDIRAMAFSVSGDLYVTGGETDVPDPLGIIDISTNSYTQVGVLWGGVDECQGLAFSPEGRLYGIVPHSHTAGTYDLFTIDLDDVETHLVGSNSGANLNQSIAFTPDGSLYALGAGQFARLNPANGSVMGSILPLNGDYRGLEIVPEPSAILLLGLGGLVLRRMQKKLKV